jgi:hypothetical protein
MAADIPFGFFFALGYLMQLTRKLLIRCVVSAVALRWELSWMREFCAQILLARVSAMWQNAVWGSRQ